MEDLGECVGILEMLIGAPAPDATTLAEQVDLHAASIAELQRTVRDNQKDMVDRYNDMLKEILALAGRIEAHMASMEGDVSLLKRVSAGPSSGNEKGGGSKLKVPEPKQFGGSKNAKELENFLWDME
ncbi:hypothetical protein PanWU01x14_159630 [Parasponia andersonii]|uniref:Uncharacterized protein n=1 Tax=Parasponia andersonii TaxID=3476 RepID=A0A2P5CEG0_PARAD|nr:hypothetical protein PanWU01x14_159630 [Parasponia andersonii]